VWTPGNHELWTRRKDPVSLRGEERYLALVELCRGLGILTPEDPYPVWDGHFARLLADGDVANNAGNWQWVAGTGHNTRPNRVMNPLRQAHRFDPSGAYVRRYVPELAGLDPAQVRAPWALDAGHRRRLGYPDPLVELT